MTPTEKMQTYKGERPSQKKYKKMQASNRKCKMAQNANKKNAFTYLAPARKCVLHGVKCSVHGSFHTFTFISNHLISLQCNPTPTSPSPKRCQHELKCTNKKKTLLSLSSGRTLSRSSQPFLQLRLKKGFDPTAVKNQHVKLCALQIYGRACLFFLFLLTLQVGVQAKQLSSS